jgi:hypothetical protein
MPDRDALEICAVRRENIERPVVVRPSRAGLEID